MNLLAKKIWTLMKTFCAILATVSVLMCACPNHTNHESRPIMKLETAIQKAEKWMNIKGVEAISDGEYQQQPCIQVLVSVDPDSIREKIPEKYYGYPVIIKYVGQIDAQ
jgi:hypothetical protein